MLKQILMAALVLVTAATAGQAQSEREQVRNKIREIKAWQVVQEVGLDETQAQQFVPLMQRHDRERYKLKAKRRKLEQELEVLVVDRSGNGSRIRAIMQDLRDVDQRAADNDRWFQEKAYPLLSLEQQARYELFEKNFSAKIRELIKEVRAQRDKGR
ncbi:MAG: hypothetical protein JW819_11060 [Candidatus Krumholzibacteriota bacterium]|nr:hypothetical protein [Candidatus Krumholzibacteriota bacterium]